MDGRTDGRAIVVITVLAVKNIRYIASRIKTSRVSPATVRASPRCCSSVLAHAAPISLQASVTSQSAQKSDDHVPPKQHTHAYTHPINGHFPGEPG